MGKLLNFIIKTSIYLVVFSVPLAWNPWTFEAFEFTKQYLLIFLVLLGILAWITKMIFVERELHVKRTPLDLPIFLFVLVATVSTFFSADLWSSLFGYDGRFSDGLLGMLAVVGLYVLVVNTVQRPASLVRVFLLSASAALTIGYLSLFGVLQQFSQLPPLLQLTGFNTVAQSLEGFSLFLAFLISFLAFLAVRAEVKQLPFAGNFLLLFASFGFLLIIDIPKAWVVLFIGLLLVLLFGLFQRVWLAEVIRLRRVWPPFILLLLVGLPLFSPTMFPCFTHAIPADPILPADIPCHFAARKVSESGKNLLLGSGPGTFALDFSRHKPADFNLTSQCQLRFDRPGNYLAEVLATTGILGFLSYLCLALWFFFASLLSLKDNIIIPFRVGLMVLLVA